MQRIRMEKRLVISEELAAKAPGLTLVYLEADVTNGPVSEALNQALHTLEAEIKATTPIEEIKNIPAIAATRKAYKACGKDPNRYRPSQEQLMRRIVRGLGLYNVNQLVDTGNLVSMKCGSSIGVFDREKISGDILTAGIGRENEPYEGIGRGPLNIEGLPVTRDAIGGIASPTSDNERTKVEDTTKKLSVIMNLYDTVQFSPEAVAEMMATALRDYCSASNIEIAIVH